MAMKKITMILLVCVFSGVVLVTISITILSRFGAREIRREIQFDKGGELTLEAVNLSLSHYCYFTYRVSGDAEIHLAYWRLKGNKVVIEK
jgi:hypothetical protein